MIHSQQQLEKQISEWGFLPFFHNGIDGFSIEELTPQEYWFSDERPGPWEWKGPVIGNWKAAYGKFFAGKAGYVDLEWMPDFINWRRSVYPLDTKSREANHVYDVLTRNESMLSNELKLASGYTLSRKRNKVRVKNLADFADANSDSPSKSAATGQHKDGPACDAIITDLEMATYVCIADFEYKTTKSGQRYGWGVARYCTPEAMYGKGITQCPRTPRQSRERIVEHILRLFPHTTEKQIQKLI